MSAKRKIQSHRIFSEDFKKSLVNDYESGKFSIKELCLLHRISGPVLYRWIYRYSTYQKQGIKIVEMSESSSQKVKELQKRIAELERIVGQKQLEIDYLNKLLEIGSKELDFDIKKNFSSKLSNGSGSANTNTDTG